MFVYVDLAKQIAPTDNWHQKWFIINGVGAQREVAEEEQQSEQSGMERHTMTRISGNISYKMIHRHLVQPSLI